MFDFLDFCTCKSYFTRLLKRESLFLQCRVCNSIERTIFLLRVPCYRKRKNYRLCLDCFEKEIIIAPDNTISFPCLK